MHGFPKALLPKLRYMQPHSVAVGMRVEVRILMRHRYSLPIPLVPPPRLRIEFQLLCTGRIPECVSEYVIPIVAAAVEMQSKLINWRFTLRRGIAVEGGLSVPGVFSVEEGES